MSYPYLHKRDPDNENSRIDIITSTLTLENGKKMRKIEDALLELYCNLAIGDSKKKELVVQS